MKTPKIICVIPSRIGSTRLSRKPLRLIQGEPMIVRVYKAAVTAQIFDEVYVATDSEEIVKVVEAADGKAVLTAANLKTGSDRVASIAEQYAKDVDVVVNLQGDEPFMKPQMLKELVLPYLNGESPEMTTLACPLDFGNEFNDPGIVKVITDQKQNAIYFSRSPIPYLRNPGVTNLPVYHHTGLYAFRRDFLVKFTQLAQTPLELAESLEQLRALEHGYRIRVCLTRERTLEINTIEDFEKAQYFKE